MSLHNNTLQCIEGFTDLDVAIQWFQESVRLTPDDHRERAERLQNLGAMCHKQIFKKE